MDLFGWFSKSPGPQEAQDQKKVLAENTQALAGMEMLVQKINASNSQDQQIDTSMEDYLNRLRREGRGI